MAYGHLFIISAASGTGKTSLVKALLAKKPELKLSVSHTTRPARPNEENGVHYHFLSDAQFVAMLGRGEFLESAHVHDARYGTSQAQVLQSLQAGVDVLLEIDWQGAQQVRQQYPDAISIFILPPSIEALAQRLNDRGQDSPAVIAKRLAAARDEMRHVVEFDYVTINDYFDVALEDLLAIIRAQGLKASTQLSRYQTLIQALT
ncbi:MAG: guanylate kinase [Methylotenera sp.]|nr:guanylate kinase [Methylotenera sp.]